MKGVCPLIGGKKEGIKQKSQWGAMETTQNKSPDKRKKESQEGGTKRNRGETVVLRNQRTSRLE